MLILIDIEDLEPLSWARTRGQGHRRVMTVAQRTYYRNLYYHISNVFIDWEIKPVRYGNLFYYLDPNVERSLLASFQRTTRRRVDTDNLVKALMDAGHPSKWGQNTEKLVPNLWEDWIFSEIHAKRRLGADEPFISITIGEPSDVAKA